MSDTTDSEKNEVREFAGLINNALSPLNELSRFKEEFKDAYIKILLNAVNLKYAALITIDHGQLRVESIANKPKENLKKKKLGWNAKLEMDSGIFLALAMNRLSMFRLTMKVITGKLKVRGIRNLLILKKILLMLSEAE
jgi:hypothetical protein